MIFFFSLLHPILSSACDSCITYLQVSIDVIFKYYLYFPKSSTGVLIKSFLNLWVAGNHLDEEKPVILHI